MPIRSKERKSSSVTSIPVKKNVSDLVRSLDDGDFKSLLQTACQPYYSKPTSGFREFQGSRSINTKRDSNLKVAETVNEPSTVVKVCLQGIRDEVNWAEKNSKTEERGPYECLSSISPPLRDRVPPSGSVFNKKPITFENMDINYIDENDVEMVDLSGSNSTRKFMRGNREETVREYTDDDVEASRGGGRFGSVHHPIHHKHGYQQFSEPDEGSLRLQDGRLMNRNQTVLPPQNGGMFSSLSYDMVGTDQLPDVNPVTGCGKGAQIGRVQSNGTHKFEDAFDKNPTQESVNTNPKLEAGKRKKQKKEKSKDNTILAKDLPGHMGSLPLDHLLNLIEGERPDNTIPAKKQSPKDKPSDFVLEETAGKKDRRRKSKDLKESGTVVAGVESAITIGNQQGRTTAQAVAQAVPSMQQAAVAKYREPAKSSPGNDKYRKNFDQPASRVVRCSTEEVEEEFLSADEGIASSTGDEICLPLSVMSIAASNQASDVMMDGANYRADDEDVTQIERHITEEQEFITVVKAKKKVNEKEKRTGSAGKGERRLRAVDRLEGGRRSSLGMPEEKVIPPNKGRRPTATSLADFIDERKDCGKLGGKTFISSPTTKTSKKSGRAEFPDSQTEVEVSSVLPVDEMSTSTQLNISGSPERTFSYADAAKKSEQSRENSPGSVVQQSSPSTKSSSPVSPLLASAEPSTTSVPSRIEASVSSGATDGISFFYDDSEAITTPSEPENIEAVQATDGNAFVLNLCGKTVRFVKGMAPSGDMQPANSRHLCMVEMLANRWKLFQEGHVPKVYQPKMMAS